MTQVSKGRDGFQAKDSIQLDGKRFLEVMTSKSGGRLGTSAHVAIHENGFVTWNMFGDFRERCMVTTQRCTEKSVTAQHATVMADIEGIKARAKAFYAVHDKPESKADEQAPAHDPMDDVNYVGHPIHY